METVTPALPTLSPQMIWRHQPTARVHPFDAPTVRYFYFARNAVWLASKILGLDRGEVLVPAYHHGVEIEALMDAGARVCFYRVGPKWDVDLEDVARKINSNTRALYLTHYAGFPGPVDAMRALADRHGIPLIEDCALSLLSAENMRPLGTTGDISIFCLYKTLPVPHGGALVANGAKSYSLPAALPPPLASTWSHALSSMLQNLELRGGRFSRALSRAARSLGRGTVRATRVDRVATGTQHFNRAHVDLGMSPFARRVALAQDFSSIVEARRRNYFFLLSRLREVSRPLFNELPPGVCPLFYPLLVEDKAPVMERLRSQGIETIDFWRHFHPNCDPTAFPEVVRLRRTVLEIPCHQDLSAEHMGAIANAVRGAVHAERRAPAIRAHS